MSKPIRECAVTDHYDQTNSNFMETVNSSPVTLNTE
jgi:hypothetical protein